MDIKGKDAKDAEPKERGLAAVFSRLPTDRLQALADMANAELDKRGGGKSPGGMSDAEFHKFVDETITKASRVTREADLRDQLAAKRKRKEASQTKDNVNG